MMIEPEVLVFGDDVHAVAHLKSGPKVGNTTRESGTEHWLGSWQGIHAFFGEHPCKCAIKTETKKLQRETHRM